MKKLRKRFIPVLMMKDGILHKSTRFKDYKYVGDPLNAVRIFNEKEVDEIALLDVGASASARGPNFELLKSFAAECFMPLTYGGGVMTIDQVKKLFDLGVEKISFNSSLMTHPEVVRETVRLYGTQAVVAAIDVTKSWLGGYKVYDHVKKAARKEDPFQWARECLKLGVGEFFLTSVDNDGERKGYDWELCERFAREMPVPTTICGGAGSIDDLKRAASSTEAQGIAAGSLFVLHGKLKAVLITYPPGQILYE